MSCAVLRGMNLASASSVARSPVRSLARTAARNVAKKIARNVARSAARNVAIGNAARTGPGRNAARMLGGIGEAPASLEALFIADGSRFCKKALLFLKED